ncbi:tetratricopeptide repeat protein [Azotobacter sp. CWF10]
MTRICWRPSCASAAMTVLANWMRWARGLAAYPDDNGLLYARALTRERRDDIPRAEADLRKILVTDPENVPALNALGYTRPTACRAPAGGAGADRPRPRRRAGQRRHRRQLWLVLYRLGRKDEALVQLRWPGPRPGLPEIAAHVGEVLWVLGKHDEARHFFDEAAKLDPENRAPPCAPARNSIHECFPIRPLLLAAATLAVTALCHAWHAEDPATGGGRDGLGRSGAGRSRARGRPACTAGLGLPSGRVAVSKGRRTAAAVASTGSRKAAATWWS